jgi:hypothetical protein
MIKLSIKTEQQIDTPNPIKSPERIDVSSGLSRNVAVSAVIGLLIGFLIGSYFPFFDDQHDQDDQKKDSEQIVEPEKKEEKKSDVPKIQAAGSWFVFIYEFQTKTADQELLVRDLRAWSMINKCDFRQFDQDSKDAEPYKIAAEKAGLKSPFMAVIRDKKIVRVFDWPRDRLALEGLVK